MDGGASSEVTGIALSPEFIYALGPGDLMPDERRFGVVWMPERALAAAYDLDGAFSNVVLKLVPGASQPDVDRDSSTGCWRAMAGSAPMDARTRSSHAFLDAELQQLKAMSRSCRRSSWWSPRFWST